MRTISIYNNFLPKNQEKREMLNDKIKKHGFNTGRDGEFMFVVGGDGTFLKAIKKNMKNNPPILIGLNTGNLGYLHEFSFDEVELVFEMIKKRDYMLESIPVYEAIVTTKNQTKRLYFVNDLIIERKETKVIHSEIQINGEKFTQVSGDGLAISTSLGSTAYNLSANGPISYDCNDVLQIVPLHPINNNRYRSLTNSVILKSNNEITILPSYKKQIPFRIVFDGNEGKFKDIRSVTIKKSPFNVKLLRSHNYKSADNLKNKILPT